MKKNIKILFLSLALVFLCSCSEQTQNEIPPEQPESQVAENNDFSQKEQTSADISDDNTVYIGIAGNNKLYQKRVETEKNRLDIIYGKDDVLNFIIETPEVEYWIINEDGNPIIDHPFYDVSFWESNENAFLDIFKSAGIEGCYEGNHYVYSYIDNKFELVEFDNAGVYEPVESYTGKSNPNYLRTRYSYKKSEIHYGLSDKNGNVIFEPIFSYHINIPFENRFVATKNNVDKMDSWESHSILYDENGKILCQYSTINFIFFDDNSYLGIAWYGGYGNNFGNILYDNEGNILKEGYRFIDKDGNELSPCFESDFLVYGAEEYAESYLDEIITTIDDGIVTEITGKDFICKP